MFLSFTKQPEHTDILENIADIRLEDDQDTSISKKFHKIFLIKYSPVFTTILSIDPNITVFKCENVSKKMLDVFYDIICFECFECIDYSDCSDITLLYNFCHKYNIDHITSYLLEYFNYNHYTFSPYIPNIVDNGDFECAIILGSERNDLSKFTFAQTDINNLSTGVLYCIKNRLISAGLCIISELSPNDLYDLSKTKSKLDNMQTVINEIDAQLFEPEILWQDRDKTMHWHALLILYNFINWQYKNTEEFKKEVHKLPYELQHIIFNLYNKYSQYMASKFDQHLTLIEEAFN